MSNSGGTSLQIALTGGMWIRTGVWIKTSSGASPMAPMLRLSAAGGVRGWDSGSNAAMGISCALSTQTLLLNISRNFGLVILLLPRSSPSPSMPLPPRYELH